MGAGTARALFVLESLDALIVKGTALLAHRDMADAQSLSNHHVRLSFPTGQNNLGALHQAVTQAAGTGHGLLLLFLFLTKADGHGGATNGHGPTPCTAFPPILSTSLPGRFTSIHQDATGSTIKINLSRRKFLLATAGAAGTTLVTGCPAPHVAPFGHRSSYGTQIIQPQHWNTVFQSVDAALQQVRDQRIPPPRAAYNYGCATAAGFLAANGIVQA